MSYCKNCKVCKLNKNYAEKEIPILEHPKVSKVFERLHLDLIGPLELTNSGNKYIMTVIDSFSRFGISTAIPNKLMKTVARAFVDNVITKFGLCKSVYSDRGLEWTGSDFRKAVKALGISQNFTSSFSPQSNGLAERYNKSLVEILRCLTFEQPKSWDLSLQLATLAYNMSYCQAIHESPFFIMYLRDPIFPVNELLNINSEALDIKSYPNEMIKRAIRAFRICKEFSDQKVHTRNKSLNASREFKKIQPGSRIYVKNLIRTKLQPRFTGPYRAEGIKGNTVFCYDLETGKSKQVSIARCRNAESITIDEMTAIYNAYPNKK